MKLLSKNFKNKQVHHLKYYYFLKNISLKFNLQPFIILNKKYPNYRSNEIKFNKLKKLLQINLIESSFNPLTPLFLNNEIFNL